MAVTPTALVAFPAASDLVHGSGQFSDPPGLTCVICEADLVLLIAVFNFYFQNSTANFMAAVINWKVVTFLPLPACPLSRSCTNLLLLSVLQGLQEVSN